MNRKFLLLGFFTLFIIPLIITGCIGSRELNELALVSGVAVDNATIPGEKTITFQIVKPKPVGQQESGGSTSASFINLSSTGTTEFDIIRNITLESGRKLFLAHNQVIIFGSALARDGIGKHTDFFIRTHESRLIAWVLIAKEKASDLLSTSPKVEQIPAKNIAEMIKERKQESVIPRVDLHHFIRKLMSKTTAAIAPIVEVEGEQKTAKLTGTAVFKQDKMVGTLNIKESRGLLWVTGEVGRGVIEIKSPKGEGQVSLEIIRASSKVTPKIQNGEIVIHIMIVEEGTLGSQSSPEDLTKLNLLTLMEKYQADAIKEEIVTAVKKAQELNADIFAFGEAVHREFPQLWSETEKNWDNIFPELKVVIEVNAKLRRTGMITQPPVSQ